MLSSTKSIEAPVPVLVTQSIEAPVPVLVLKAHVSNVLNEHFSSIKHFLNNINQTQQQSKIPNVVHYCLYSLTLEFQLHQDQSNNYLVLLAESLGCKLSDKIFEKLMFKEKILRNNCSFVEISTFRQYC